MQQCPLIDVSSLKIVNYSRKIVCDAPEAKPFVHFTNSSCRYNANYDNTWQLNCYNGSWVTNDVVDGWEAVDEVGCYVLYVPGIWSIESIIGIDRCCKNADLRRTIVRDPLRLPPVVYFRLTKALPRSERHVVKPRGCPFLPSFKNSLHRYKYFLHFQFSETNHENFN